MWRARFLRRAVLALLLVAIPAWAEELTPETVVKNYLTALKANDFKSAWDCISKGMAQNKPKEEWAKEHQWIMQMSEAKILEFHVYPGKIEGEKAIVPNLLSSQDKFLNQLGVEEHELYTLIREEGKWKIDQQQLVEHGDEGKWFPADKSKKP